MTKKGFERHLRSLVRERQRFLHMFFYNSGNVNIWIRTKDQSIRVRNEMTTQKMIDAYSQSLELEINYIQSVLKQL